MSCTSSSQRLEFFWMCENECSLLSLNFRVFLALVVHSWKSFRAMYQNFNLNLRWWWRQSSIMQVCNRIIISEQKSIFNDFKLHFDSMVIIKFSTFLLRRMFQSPDVWGNQPQIIEPTCVMCHMISDRREKERQKKHKREGRVESSRRKFVKHSCRKMLPLDDSRLICLLWLHLPICLVVDKTSYGNEANLCQWRRFHEQLLFFCLLHRVRHRLERKNINLSIPVADSGRAAKAGLTKSYYETFSLLASSIITKVSGGQRFDRNEYRWWRQT